MIKCKKNYRQFALILILAIMFVFNVARPVAGQGVDFEIPVDDENYAVYLTSLGGYEVLDFGWVILGYNYNIELNSDDLAILEISGVRYLDIFVTLSTDPYLYLDGLPTSDIDKRIAFSFKGAYANQGEGNISAGYRQPFNGTAVRFPIFRRSSGPPGPPPVPPHSGYKPPRESAYLFLYGGIEVPASVNSGTYGGQITVTVEYDL